MWFATNTQHDASKVLRLPRKMTMEASKALRLTQKLQRIFRKRRKSIAPATQNDFRHVTKHVWMSRSATPVTRNEATRHVQPPEVTPFAELTIGTAIRASHGRPRTVANINATSSEHTLNPQTPRVKREPLLRIREQNMIETQVCGKNKTWSCTAPPQKKANNLQQARNLLHLHSHDLPVPYLEHWQTQFATLHAAPTHKYLDIQHSIPSLKHNAKKHCFARSFHCTRRGKACIYWPNKNINMQETRFKSTPESWKKTANYCCL